MPNIPHPFLSLSLCCPFSNVHEVSCMCSYPNTTFHLYPHTHHLTLHHAHHQHSTFSLTIHHIHLSATHTHSFQYSYSLPVAHTSFTHSLFISFLSSHLYGFYMHDSLTFFQHLPLRSTGHQAHFMLSIIPTLTTPTYPPLCTIYHTSCSNKRARP